MSPRGLCCFVTLAALGLAAPQIARRIVVIHANDAAPQPAFLVNPAAHPIGVLLQDVLSRQAVNSGR